jgi:hypothetical protein
MSNIELPSSSRRQSSPSERKPLNTDSMDAEMKEDYNTRMRVTIGIKDLK